MRRNPWVRVGVLAICATAAFTAGGRSTEPVAAHGGDRAGEAAEFDLVKLFIEFNSTDEDVGLQLNLDGDAWRSLKGFNPRGELILDYVNRRSLSLQGVSSLFFESSEPTLKEVPLEEFFARFPEGEYKFKGVTVDLERIEGVGSLTHKIPAGPEIVSPPQAEEPPEVDVDDLVITWKPVEEDIFGSDDIEIVGYQVTVAQLEPFRELSFHLPATVTSIPIPAEFFEQLGEEHEFEVLAIEIGGNQTITAGAFVPER